MWNAWGEVPIRWPILLVGGIASKSGFSNATRTYPIWPPWRRINAIASAARDSSSSGSPSMSTIPFW